MSETVQINNYKELECGDVITKDGEDFKVITLDFEDDAFPVEVEDEDEDTDWKSADDLEELLQDATVVRNGGCDSDDSDEDDGDDDGDGEEEEAKD